MYKKLSVFILGVFLIGCHQKEKKEELADLNLYITSSMKIDSLFISNITQDREFYFIPYSDTLKVKFKDSINDLYNIWFFAEGKQYSGPSTQVWLNGENVIIKGTFDKKLNIDTVIGSDLYYKGKEFQKGYRNLYKSKANSEEIDEFLFNFAKDHLDTPLSLQAADYYLFRNKNDKEKVLGLKKLIDNQPNQFKDHLAFQIHQTIDKILSQTKIDLTKYKFQNENGQITSIKLNENKRYLLDLWFVNCPPCIKDHKSFLNEPQLLSENNIELIGISTDSKNEVWSNFLKKKKYPWKNYRQANYKESLTKDMLISVFPTYFLMEGNGKIIQTFNAFDDVKQYISQQL
jgi:peroxiredoxin